MRTYCRAVLGRAADALDEPQAACLAVCASLECSQKRQAEPSGHAQARHANIHHRTCATGAGAGARISSRGRPAAAAAAGRGAAGCESRIAATGCAGASRTHAQRVRRRPGRRCVEVDSSDGACGSRRRLGWHRLRRAVGCGQDAVPAAPLRLCWWTAAFGHLHHGGAATAARRRVCARV
jgi:hypothetical protein